MYMHQLCACAHITNIELHAIQKVYGQGRATMLHNDYYFTIKAPLKYNYWKLSSAGTQFQNIETTNLSGEENLLRWLCTR